MRLYLDSSALVKLVKREDESDRLRQFLRQHAADGRVTSALARVELVRAVASGGPAAVAHARRLLGRFDEIQMGRDLLDDAATLLARTVLRSLDAIHLASARTLGPELRAIICYDGRMQVAAAELGIIVESPA